MQSYGLESVLPTGTCQRQAATKQNPAAPAKHKEYIMSNEENQKPSLTQYESMTITSQ